MSIRFALARTISRHVRAHPALNRILKRLDADLDLLQHSMAQVLPQVIRPDPRQIFVTLTANCNLRCMGCRYGRDFMPGSQLAWNVIRDLLEDAKRLGIPSIRFYGGEPLLHKNIVRAVEYSVKLGLNTWITTNAVLLKEKIDDLFKAGLRSVEVGFYGVADEYNSYVQRENQFSRVEAGIAYLRERYGMTVSLALGWLLMRPSCTLEAFRNAWRFAERYSAPLGVSLIHYSLPYFTEGPDRELQFRAEDLPAVRAVVGELIRLKNRRPELLLQSLQGLRSIPDWLMKGSGMRVPCDRRRLIWVGADGTVQMCYVTFRLGNLNQNRLSELLFTKAHAQAARSAFTLDCPNCHCNYDERVQMHLPSRIEYSRGWPWVEVDPLAGPLPDYQDETT